MLPNIGECQRVFGLDICIRSFDGYTLQLCPSGVVHEPQSRESLVIVDDDVIAHVVRIDINKATTADRIP